MKNRGITIIALIVTVVVMLIVAGVGISAVIDGDSSVVTQAEKSIYKNSITTIEQWLNEVYVQNYNEMFNTQNTTKAEALAGYFANLKNEDNSNIEWADKVQNSRDTVFHSYAYDANDRWFYNDEIYKYYILNTKNLKYFANLNNINIEILDLGISDYENFKYVYGITSDLKVYIINENKDDIISIDNVDFDIMEAATIIFDKNSTWQTVISTQYAELGDKDLNFEQIKSVSTLKIDANLFTQNNLGSNIAGIAELKSLKRIELINLDATSAPDFFRGLCNASSSLEFLQIVNCKFDNFSGVERLSNLKTLYFIKCGQSQFDKLFTAMKSGNYSVLSTIGIFGYNYSTKLPDGSTAITLGSDGRYQATDKASTELLVNNVKKMSGLSATTKGALRTLYLNNNKIESLEGIEGFTKLTTLRADCNQISNINALTSLTKLTSLMMPQNNITDVSLLYNSNQTRNKIVYLDLRKNPDLVHVSNLDKVVSTSGYLYFKSPESINIADSNITVNIDTTELSAMKTFLSSLGTRLQIDKIYSSALISDNSTAVELVGNMTARELYQLVSCKNSLRKLSLDRVNLTDTDVGVATLNFSNADEVYQYVLGQLTKVKYLQILSNNQIQSINFMSGYNEIIEFDLRGCNQITDLTILNGLGTLETLAIDNGNIELKNIQTTINRLGDVGSSVFSGGYGLQLCNANLYSKLKDCKELTRLIMYRGWRAQKAANSSDTLDLSETKLTDYGTYALSLKTKLPSTLKIFRYASGGDQCDLSSCENLETIQLYDNITDFTKFKNMLSALPDKQKLKTFTASGQSRFSDLQFLSQFTNLQVLQITGWSDRYCTYNTLEPIKNLTKLTRITLSYPQNLKLLPDLSNLTELTEISITNSALIKISKETKLNELPKLETVTLSSNKISNIEVFAEDGFNALKYLNLETNSLYSTSQYNEETSASYNLCVRIFIPLARKNLNKLYLSGNPELLKDTANLNILKNVRTWAGKSGF